MLQVPQRPKSYANIEQGVGKCSAAMNTRLTRDILGLSGLITEPPTTHHLEDVYDRDRHGSSGRHFRHRNRG